MKIKYIFFNELITIELDLENSEHKACYDVLTTVNTLYSNVDHTLFKQLKKLMDDAKTINQSIKLVIVERNSLDTGARYNSGTKTIQIEVPDISNQETLDKNLFHFYYCLIFETCNSVNKYFNSHNIEQIFFKTILNPELYAITMELAEHETCKQCDIIIEETRKNLYIILDMLKINEQYDVEHNCEHITMKILSEYMLEKSADDFYNHWQHENSKASSFNRDLTHSDVFRHNADLVHNMAYNLTLSQAVAHASENDPEEDEIELNIIYKEIIDALKDGTFDITLTKQKYFEKLKTIALNNYRYKADYYSLYHIIMNDGKKVNLEQLSWFFEISSIIVNVANGSISIKQASEDERILIYEAFDIIDMLNKLDLHTAMEKMLKEYNPILQDIKTRNPVIAEKYKDSLYSINSSVLSLPLDVLAKAYAEIMPKNPLLDTDLLHRAQNLYFTFGKGTKIELIGGTLEIDANGYSNFFSPKLIGA